MLRKPQWNSVMRACLFWLVVIFSYDLAVAELPEVTEKALSDLGSTYGTPQMNGFVFIDGRYIQPPYTVTRKGNGIFINRIQVEQPAPWPPLEQADAAGTQATKKAVDADGDFEAVDKAETPVAAGAPAAEAPAKSKAVKSIDDLFADDDAPAKATTPAPAVDAQEAKTTAAPLQPQVAAENWAPEDQEREKESLIANLERLRKGYEQSLSRGDMFFFGQRHSRVNGNYGTARTLMKVLPKALRYAESPNDLWQRLTQGGVYFIDMGICVELYRNKFTFPQLEECQRKIDEAEALEAMRRKPASVW